MTRKIYRTAQGKMVDLGKLQLQNENTRAVGNMGVNARGDKVDSLNRPIERRPAQVQRQYNKQTTPASTGAPARRAATPLIIQDIPAAPEDFQDDFVKDSAPASGLAAAIAKAREIKQDPLRTAKDTADHQSGVRKL